MPDYERTATVTTNPDDAFRFLSDPANLPKYVDTMSFAGPQQGERLRVAAEVQGRHEEGHARFTTNQELRRIEWGAEGESGYAGRLEVSEKEGGSSVRFHVHVDHDQDQAEINRAMDETVSNIERLLGAG